jgi:LEA14-like dessication related protein
MLEKIIAKISVVLFTSIYIKIVLLSLLTLIFFPTIPKIDLIKFTPINQRPFTDSDSNIITKWELVLRITNNNIFPLKFDNLTINAKAKNVKVAYGFIENFHVKLKSSKIYSIDISAPIYHNRNLTNIYNECLNEQKLKLNVNLLGEIFLFQDLKTTIEKSLFREFDCSEKKS